MRRVFVTGGGSGIGLAIARAFASDGAAVTIAGRDLAKLRATGLSHFELDVTDDEHVLNVVKAAGPIDVFVANAGRAASCPALKTSRALLDEMLAVNLSSVFACARAAIPGMIERGAGRFIAVASTAALKGYPYVAAYAAAKHGVLGLIRTLAVELAATGVTANAICPGFTDTPMADEAVRNVVSKTGRSPDEARKMIAAYNPMRRFVTPEEVAAAALFLASDAAASVNGQAIAVDGGETA